MKKGASYLDSAGFWQDLETLLGCSVDVNSDGGVSPYLRDQIEREAKALSRETRGISFILVWQAVDEDYRGGALSDTLDDLPARAERLEATCGPH